MNQNTDPKPEAPAEEARASETEAAPADQAGDAATETQGAQDAEATPERDPVEVLKAENAELRDKLMRTIADMENLRRRTEREKQDASRYAIGRFAEDVLSVGDNLARALAALDTAAREAADEATKNLIDGIEVTERGFHNVLSRHGITRLDPDGERFDPNFHQAMFEVENADVPSGTVVQVVQAGYTIGDRVLRPAMVGVSKGGPKAAPAAGNGAEAQAEPEAEQSPAGTEEPGAQVDKEA